MAREKYDRYSDDFKLKVLSDYFERGMSKYFIARKWGINRGLIDAWIKIWPIDPKELSLPDEIISTSRMSDKDSGKSGEQILQERISSLEKSLAYERMRSRAFEKLIEIAEREEGISILKKGGVKQ